MNREKRKARQAVLKQRSREPEDGGDEPDKKKIKVEVKEENNASLGEFYKKKNW